jgi:orotidine-5'-phosphate decarboxylase
MTRDELFQNIMSKQSFLCVGLDTDLDKIPSHLQNLDDPVFEFNKQIIDATIPYAVAYKPNLAFYEVLGPRGLESLEKTLEYIPDELFTIADAKRGDIGNTSNMYAKAFFEKMNFDSITLSPYMGHDSILPYLEYKGKWAIILALTSNEGSIDFQHLDVAGDHHDFFDIENKELFELVIDRCEKLGSTDQIMFVVGATKAKFMKNIRGRVPDHFFLIPGVGAQGGSLEDVAQSAMNDHCGILVNASRSIIYASSGEDFAEAAATEAKSMQQSMKQMLDRYL